MNLSEMAKIAGSADGTITRAYEWVTNLSQELWEPIDAYGDTPKELWMNSWRALVNKGMAAGALAGDAVMVIPDLLVGDGAVDEGAIGDAIEIPLLNALLGFVRVPVMMVKHLFVGIGWTLGSILGFVWGLGRAVANYLQPGALAETPIPDLDLEQSRLL